MNHKDCLDSARASSNIAVDVYEESVTAFIGLRHDAAMLALLAAKKYLALDTKDKDFEKDLIVEIDRLIITNEEDGDVNDV